MRAAKWRGHVTDRDRVRECVIDELLHADESFGPVRVMREHGVGSGNRAGDAWSLGVKVPLILLENGFEYREWVEGFHRKRDTH